MWAQRYRLYGSNYHIHQRSLKSGSAVVVDRTWFYEIERHFAVGAEVRSIGQSADGPFVCSACRAPWRGALVNGYRMLDAGIQESYFSIHALT